MKNFKLDIDAAGEGKIYLGGKELENVTDIKIEAGVGKITTVTVKFFGPVEGEIRTYGEITVREFEREPLTIEEEGT